jgi:phage host-nuclease inhibitor protein Gam
MPKRNKPDPANPLAVTSLDDADGVLLDLANVEREIAEIEIILNKDIEAARQFADDLARPLREKRASLEAALTTYATAGKDSLFKKAKSIKLTHGVIGFRASDELKTLAKVTWKEVLGRVKGMAAKLKALDLPACVRVKEEPDKDALRQLPESLREEAGVRIVGKDTFYYECKTEEIAEKSAA